MFKCRSEKELKKQYSRCSKDKCVFFNGKLFSCGCSAFGSTLNAFKIKSGEYIDFRKNQNKKEIKKQLSKLKGRPYFTACNYCNWETDSLIPIKAAEQMQKPCE